MPLINKFEKDNSTIGIWKIEEEESSLMNILSEEKIDKDKLNSFTSLSRRKEFLSVRALIKSMLGFLPQIDYHSQGKPFFKDFDYNISISHTKGFATVIISKSESIGIDIEQLGDRAFRIKDKFLSEAEIKAMDEKNPSLYCCICWSAKETLFKALGCTDVFFDEMLLLSPFLTESNGIINASEKRTLDNMKFKINYQTTNDFVLTYLIS
ncbi:MAG: 4'-phosphopantetheinyl transferase superfamily protein [Bacteroidales bacterium]|nr:4'-phosphopantetheinyl transferase superfamily protein [Bacteroidales bacterium]